MNNINTNNEHIIATRNGWGKIALFWMVVIALGIASKGCNTDKEPELQTFIQHQ